VCCTAPAICQPSSRPLNRGNDVFAKFLSNLGQCCVCPRLGPLVLFHGIWPCNKSTRFGVAFPLSSGQRWRWRSGPKQKGVLPSRSPMRGARARYFASVRLQTEVCTVCGLQARSLGPAGFQRGYASNPLPADWCTPGPPRTRPRFRRRRVFCFQRQPQRSRSATG